eukprot:739392-Prymnesium_polylepis.1
MAFERCLVGCVCGSRRAFTTNHVHSERWHEWRSLAREPCGRRKKVVCALSTPLWPKPVRCRQP